MVKRFVGPSTREKIKFLYGKEVTDEVLKFFDPSARKTLLSLLLRPGCPPAGRAAAFRAGVGV